LCEREEREGVQQFERNSRTSREKERERGRERERERVCMIADISKGQSRVPSHTRVPSRDVDFQEREWVVTSASSRVRERDQPTTLYESTCEMIPVGKSTSGVSKVSYKTNNTQRACEHRAACGGYHIWKAHSEGDATRRAECALHANHSRECTIQ
jgi:hypothetical protein